ncbi:Activating molecule in BECN1-regulated autophagy protein 1 [Mizuhopecten yessoensis]|uniref:Activating molecule in BECN1-regulated autophagy protein 1 n=1 Tax=Mizuhopecten yessoensis TaxID=6573 RepID=A0A210Q596_MIZYE|nr:Activating molecule in BECN1-regulated autophagy protein 1 [Mizuhopecten yessoensis]
MKNFVSFLCQRELGRTTKCWKQTKQAEECLEKHACTPEVNQPCALSGQVRATFLMDFSPDGTKVASTHGDHTVRVTELSTGKCTHILSGHPRTPWCLAFHPSSDQILASGCLAGEVRIWDLQGGGSEVWRCKDSLVIASMTFHPIDHVLVFAVGNKIYFWDWNQTEPFACCQTLHEYERIRLVRFDSVGHYLYTGIANNTMVQQANSRISFINGRNNPVARPQRTQRLSSVYNNLVECFRAYRRDRVMNEGSAAEGTNCEYTDAQESSASRERSRSPVHEEGLNFARQYAARVTEATMLPTGSEHERNPSETEPNPDSDSVPFINDSVPPFMAPRPFAWSPPPRGASQADEVGDIIIEEEEEEEEDRVQRPVDLGQINLNHSVGENSSSNLVAMERNNETGAMNVRMATNREATTSMSSVLSTRLADSNRSVATHRGLPGSREPPTLQSTPVLRTDSHSGTNGLGQHASDCDNRDCQVCGNFNRSQLTYGRWEPFAGRRFSHARSAFSQPSHTYRQRYRNLNPSRVQVHSYGPARRQGVGVATSQNPISTHVASSQTSTETSSSPVQVPAAESQPSSQQNRLSSLLHLASQAQQGIHIPPSQLNPLLQRLSDSSLPQDSSTGDRLTSQNVDGNAVLQTQGDSYVATNQDSSQSNSVLQTHSDNNNNDQSETSEHTSSGDNNNGQGYRAIQDNFATITARIEREMDELDRRITSLRNSFHESAFMGRGEPAVANNIINHTHRIQAWDFTKCDIPDITDPTVDVIVPHCKLHNDASCDISQDRTLLGTFVPSHRGFPDDNILAIFSLVPESRGQCLFTKSFGPNAISVSISPRTNFVMVGLAAKRLSWVFTSNQLVAQVYKMESELAGEKSTQHVSDIMHPCDMDIRTHVSVNSARWLPGVGDGIIYGTNRGDLHICRPGAKKESEKEKPNDTTTSGTSIRRNLMHMLGLSSTAVPLISIGTQTAERRSAGTQTE